jgi:hypothetical protein
MKPQYVLACLLLINGGCHTESTNPSDPSFVSYGIVVDTISVLPIDSVVIGFKNPIVADSIVFIGDSVVQVGPNSEKYVGLFIGKKGDAYFGQPIVTAKNGLFSFGGAFIDGPPLYQNMFAYRKGYHLWRFASTKDAVIRIQTETDSLMIKLNKK